MNLLQLSTCQLWCQRIKGYWTKANITHTPVTGLLCNIMPKLKLYALFLFAFFMLGAPAAAMEDSDASGEPAESAEPLASDLSAKPSISASPVDSTVSAENFTLAVESARPFKGEISKEMARLAAFSEIRIKAANDSVPALVKLETLRFFLSDQSFLEPGLPPLSIFGHILLSRTYLSEEVIGIAPEFSVKLSCSFSIIPARQQRESLL